MKKYAVLLRGINVGGNKKVPMAELKTLLEKSGFTDVRTLLASGNVLLTIKPEPEAALGKRIASLLEKHFGFPIPVLIREIDELEKLAKTEPFRGITVTKDIRLYVTFLGDPPTTKMKIPYSSDDGALRILYADARVVISVLDLSKGKGTVDAMSIIEKEYGKLVTTRNWNTIEKMLK